MYQLLICLLIQTRFTSVHSEFLISKFGRNVVTTALGKYRGVQVDLQHASNFTLQDVDSFRGVEYGSVENGLFRYMPSKNIYTLWDFVKKTGMFGNSCNQRSLWGGWFTLSEPKRMSLQRTSIYKHVIHSSEECLNLNLYIPTGKYR